MAINNSQLSDQTLNMNVVAIPDACSTWEKEVSTADLSGINLESTFAPLISNHIAESYIASLKAALSQVENQAKNISGLLKTAVTKQTAADQQGYNASNNNSYSSYSNRNGSGGGTNNSTSNTPGTSVDNKELDLDINKDGKVDEKDVSEETVLKVVTAFHNIFNGKLREALFDAKDASVIKKELLASPNLDENVKKLIGQLDDKTLIALIKKQYLTGKMMSDFSKVTITVFDNDLKEIDDKETIFDAADNISKTYEKLAESKDAQVEIEKLYRGDPSIKDVSDNTILYTRRMVEVIATAANKSYEDILTNADYKDAINNEVKNIADAFAVIYGAKTNGETTSSKLYSNMIVKG